MIRERCNSSMYLDFLPEFAKNKLNIIALCNVSLMCSVPGAQFVSYLARIRNEEVSLPVCSEDIYDYYLKNHNYLVVP